MAKEQNNIYFTIVGASVVLAIPYFFLLGGHTARHPGSIFFLALLISLAVVISSVFILKPILLHKDKPKHKK